MEKHITHQINEAIIQILEDQPEGMRRKDLLEALANFNPNWHPKTVNGCVWLIHEKFPEQVYKPERGVFQLVKYQ